MLRLKEISSPIWYQVELEEEKILLFPEECQIHNIFVTYHQHTTRSRCLAKQHVMHGIETELESIKRQRGKGLSDRYILRY